MRPTLVLNNFGVGFGISLVMARANSTESSSTKMEEARAADALLQSSQSFQGQSVVEEKNNKKPNIGDLKMIQSFLINPDQLAPAAMQEVGFKMCPCRFSIRNSPDCVTTLVHLIEAPALQRFAGWLAIPPPPQIPRCSFYWSAVLHGPRRRKETAPGERRRPHLD